MAKAQLSRRAEEEDAERAAERAAERLAAESAVITTLRKVSDFVFFLPFLFSLYHHPEPSRTFYDNPHTSVLTHVPDCSSMMRHDVV